MLAVLESVSRGEGGGSHNPPRVFPKILHVIKLSLIWAAWSNFLIWHSGQELELLLLSGSPREGYWCRVHLAMALQELMDCFAGSVRSKPGVSFIALNPFPSKPGCLMAFALFSCLHYLETKTPITIDQGLQDNFLNFWDPATCKPDPALNCSLKHLWRVIWACLTDTAVETPRKRSKDRFFKQCLRAVTHVNTTQRLKMMWLITNYINTFPSDLLAYSGADRALTSLISENP